MGKDDVRQALEAMDDEAVRARLADGDFGDVSQLDLSEEERQLVQNAASDYPDVAGFAVDAFLKPDVSSDNLPKIDFSPGFNAAVEYSQKY